MLKLRILGAEGMDPVSAGVFWLDRNNDRSKRQEKAVPVNTLRNGSLYPRADQYESDQDSVIRLDVPGAVRGDIKVDYDAGQLRVVWNKQPDVGNALRYLSRESFSGTFTRTFALPGPVDVNRITAEVESGVMTIRVPKSKTTARREIGVS